MQMFCAAGEFSEQNNFTLAHPARALNRCLTYSPYRKANPPKSRSMRRLSIAAYGGPRDESRQPESASNKSRKASPQAAILALTEGGGTVHSTINSSFTGYNNTMLEYTAPPPPRPNATFGNVHGEEHLAIGNRCDRN